MKFFTDKTVINDYLLVKIVDYVKMKDKSKWEEILIDPGVYDLTKGFKFSWEGDINIPEFLDSLPGNHYFSCDLPSDMNLKYKKYFLEKSWQYAKAYSYHPQFIVTVQFFHNNYWSFKENFDRYNALNIKSGFLGIGNYCKHHYYNEFVKHSLPYAFKHSNCPRIHIYGCSLRLIPIAYRLADRYGVELSVDSTKWDFYWYERDYERGNRQKAFNWYMDKIKTKGVVLENTIWEQLKIFYGYTLKPNRGNK